jgi:hypothetical protein
MRLIFIFLFYICTVEVHSQGTKYCQSLEAFLNSPNVISSFEPEDKTSSLLLFNKTNYFPQDCPGVRWKGSFVALNPYSSITTKTTDPNILFRDSCNIFIILEFSRKGKLHNFSLLQPCSNLRTEGTVKVKNRKYKLVSIGKYVL